MSQNGKDRKAREAEVVHELSGKTIVAHAGKDCMFTAKDRKKWNSLEEAFTRRGST